MTKDSREDIGFLLNEATHFWRIELDRRLEPTGLSQATWRALFHLDRLGDGLTQRALAESIGIEGPSLVRLLDHLEKAELVERRASATDRRCNLLFLTPEGHNRVTEIKVTAAEVRQALLAGLSDEQIEQIRTALRLIITNASQLTARQTSFA